MLLRKFDAICELSGSEEYPGIACGVILAE